MYRKVNGLESWDYEFDINGYEPGTYNIIIEGIDGAGNRFEEGPFDLIIDPESDKPSAHITNPEPGMGIKGNLNIIGTCLDDDGVEYVEVKINDGAFTRAEGTEFWSSYLETETLQDGPVLISVRGVDINGVAGDEESVEFVLDRTAPENSVTSLENGSLVNGKIVLEGTVSDSNGIEALEYSADGGVSYSSVAIKGKKKEPVKTFRIPVNTYEMEDGPHVFWFRSYDKTGSAGLSSFLFFVDNQPPELDILYPVEEDRVNGLFPVTGRIADEIGVESLTCRTGKGDPEEIALTEGDPYWTKIFDFTGENKADVTFELTDKAGNKTEVRFQKDLDEEGDAPVLELLSPQPEGKTDTPFLAGFVSDDDGTEKVVYSLDGGAPVDIPARYAFCEEWENLAPGAHRLEIYPVDENGIAGETRKISFRYSGQAPEIRLSRYLLAEGDGDREFEQALEWEGGLYKSLEGTVLFRNTPENVVYSWDGGEENKLSLKKSTASAEQIFSVPLKDLLPGYHELKIRASDEEGKEGDGSFYFFMTGEGASGPEKKLYVADSRFLSSGKPATPVVFLEKGEPAVFSVGDDEAEAAVLSFDSDWLSVETRNDRVLLTARSPGREEDVMLTIETTSGKTYTVGPFSAVLDEQSPQITLEEDYSDLLTAGPLEMHGSVADDTGVVEIASSLNGGEFIPCEREGDSFHTVLDLSGYPDGNLHLQIRATDGGERISIENFCFRKDASPPLFRQLTPRSEDRVNGLVSFSGIIEEPGKISLAEYAVGEETPVPLTSDIFPVLPLDLTALDESDRGLLRITDEAGNTAEYAPVLNFDREGDAPEVQIQIPGDGYLADRDFRVYGMAFDDDRIERLSYRIDGGDPVEIEGGNNFEIPLAIDELGDNEHSLDVVAYDINGVVSEPAVLTFRISRDEPVSELSAPALGMTVKGTVMLRGTTNDENGIGAVYISYDNGNSYNRAVLIKEKAKEEAEPEAIAENGESEQNTLAVEDETTSEIDTVAKSVNWQYKLNTSILKDGAHSLLVKAYDRYGVTSLHTTMVNVDNTPPEIDLSFPAEGEQVTGSVQLQAILSDNMALREVQAHIQSLESPEKFVSRELVREGLVNENIDLSSLPEGWVNLRLIAFDETGNQSVVSRNLFLTEKNLLREVILYTPPTGSFQTGDLLIQGKGVNLKNPERINLYADDRVTGEPALSENGYFTVSIPRGTLIDGEHTLRIAITDGDGEEVSSDTVKVNYRSLGPWIQIEDINAGDYVTQRPWLTCLTGYEYEAPDLEGKELEKYGKTKEAESVEISLDNGKSFRSASGKNPWKFRLETQELEAGETWILARARFADGTSAMTKTLVIVDEKPPQVELVTPQEGMRFNGNIPLSGLAEDENGLVSVSAALREGSKRRYQVPSFIQGLYLDMHFLGATTFEAGAGLTFFEDNVKLQVQLGTSPPGRFFGFVSGMKLLANLAVVPWDYFLGYDYKDFSSSVAMGTVFDYFSMSEDSPFGGDGVILAALLTQLELVKWNNPEWNMFSSFAFYTEFQFWFISSDVNAGIEPRLTFGVRTDVF